MPVSVPSVAYATAGGVLLYSGLTGDTVSDTLRSLLKGQKPTGTVTAPVPVAAQETGSVALPGEGAGSPVSSTAARNQAIARVLAAPYGWATGSEWNALAALWNRESGWSNTADTRVTHAGGDGPGSPVFAYGIAQARPASKYPLPGRPPDLGGVSDPTSQIAWGLAYIASTYGSASNAWAHEESAGWY